MNKSRSYLFAQPLRWTGELQAQQQCPAAVVQRRIHIQDTLLRPFMHACGLPLLQPAASSASAAASSGPTTRYSAKGIACSVPAPGDAIAAVSSGAGTPAAAAATGPTEAVFPAPASPETLMAGPAADATPVPAPGSGGSSAAAVQDGQPAAYARVQDALAAAAAVVGEAAASTPRPDSTPHPAEEGAAGAMNEAGSSSGGAVEGAADASVCVTAAPTNTSAAALPIMHAWVLLGQVRQPAVKLKRDCDRR